MNIEQLKVIFVDDEQRILDGLRRQLHDHRQQWEMRFALSGDEALKMLASEPADIIVSDMRMSGMTGGELLQRVLQQYPQTTRVILSGQTDQQHLLKDIGAIHQYLQKPCEPATLCAAIERTFRLAQRLRKPELRLTANRVTALPPSTRAFRLLMDELSREDASVTKVADIVSGDPALSVKLMQLVNSAFFGMPRRISTPQEAVVLLGLKTIHTLVIASRLFGFLDDNPATHHGVAQLWDASMKLGELASRLAQVDGCDAEVQKRCRLAGMLCLIGRAILFTADTSAYARAVSSAEQSGAALSDTEMQQMGATQDDVTAYALGIWCFSDELVDSVLFQRHPSTMPTLVPRHPVTYLHLARSMIPVAFLGRSEILPLDQAFADGHGLGALIHNSRRLVA